MSGAAAKVASVEVPDLELAYFAGIVDGEGSIGIYRTHYKTSSGRRFIAYVLFITVTNTNKPLLERLKHYFNGSIHMRPAVRNRRTCFDWKIGHVAGKEFLARILPYLFIKKEQALIGMACQSLNDKRRSNQETARAKALQARMKIKITRLKHV